jgi:hypothetical protein
MPHPFPPDAERQSNVAAPAGVDQIGGAVHHNDCVLTGSIEQEAELLIGRIVRCRSDENIALFP